MFKKFVKMSRLIKQSACVIYEWPLSMSEALNALPNLSISSSQIFKQEIPSPPSKNEQTNGSPLGERFSKFHSKFLFARS